MAIFEVPTNLQGKTLKQIRDESNAAFRPDVLASLAGIDENTPLTAGQAFTLPNDPGSGEYKFVQGTFSPQGTKATADRQAFNLNLQGQEQEFLNRFKEEYPQILSGIEQNLNLPNLRQSAYDLSDTLREIPSVQTGATRGFDVNANQLARIISSEQEKIAPVAQEAVRQAQFGEEEFGRQSERALKPFETEIDLLKDRLSRESTGFDTDAKNRLDLLLTQIQEEGAMDREKISQATKLAELEQRSEEFKKSFVSVDLGNRVAILDASGKEVGSYAKGKLPSSGNGGNVGEYLKPLEPTPSFRPIG